jgi:multimeric flavodoxin WrbA
MENSNKPLVLLGSARKDSNTKRLITSLFLDQPYNLVDLNEKLIESFNYDSAYSASDNFWSVVEEILKHDNLVFATPVYWYSMSGVMKNFFDRFTDLITKHKETGRKLRGKKTFLVTISNSPAIPEGFELPFKETSQYLGMQYGGYYFASNQNLEALPNTNRFLEKVYNQEIPA